MNEQNKNIYISYWLLLITFLVALMIIVGGLTRLTDSGLSITKWDLISGIIPPLSINDWNNAFSLYKKIPEYKIINSSMTLDEFKIIYWWEYFHRFLGRIIGLVFLIPLFYFTIKRKIEKNFLKTLYLILFLICLQGLIGWYMVTSGLTSKTDVSHYRLSLHLTLAFIILILVFWNYLKYTNKKNYKSFKKIPILINLFFFCLIIQISIGAFVSGLDAGKIYQTWPLMNNRYFPDDSLIKDLSNLNLFENPSIVQFIHRNIAYFVFFLFLIIFIKIFRNNNLIYLRKSAFLVFLSLFFQIIIGILTILSGAHLILSSMHQIGSIILIITSLILVFKNSKIN